METITIKDIARICGVGVSTVSRAINNHPDISTETKEMIMKTIKDCNYIPNNSARNLKRSDSKTIAVLIKGIDNPFFNRIIKIFERELQKKGYSFILHRVEEQENEINVACQLEKEKKLRGIVFLGGNFRHTEEQLKQIKVPYVLCTTGLLEKIDEELYSSVSIDDFKESYNMTKFLCELGHKRIAIITAGEEDASVGIRREAGYKAALIDCGLEVDEELIFFMKKELDTYSMENGYEITKDILKSGVEFTALYAIADNMAVGACKALLEAGKKIPEDCSVAGFDGIELTKYYHPSITTMCQPREKIAEATIQLLFDLIKKQRKNSHIIFSTELSVRESTKRI